MNTQELLSTKCNKCVFTKVKDGKQIGCQLGRLEKYKDLKKTKLNDDGYYSITTPCEAFRPTEWLQFVRGDILEQIDKEIDIKYFSIVHYFNEDLEGIKYIKDTVESISLFPVPPQFIYVLTGNLKINYHTLYQDLGDTFNIPIRIARIMDKSLSLGEKIDSVTRKKDTTFFHIVRAKTSSPKYDCIKYVNNKVKNELRPIILCYNPKEGFDNMVVHNLASRYCGGSRNKPVFTKLIELAEDQDNPGLIHEIT